MLSRMAPSSPPVKRTLHLLKTPDILCANDNRLTGSYWLINLPKGTCEMVQLLRCHPPTCMLLKVRLSVDSSPTASKDVSPRPKSGGFRRPFGAAKKAVEADLDTRKKNLITQSSDLESIAKSLSGADLDNALAIDERAEWGMSYLDATVWFVVTYNRMQCDDDKNIAKTVLQNRLAFYAHMLDMAVDQTNGYLGRTRPPAVAQQGQRIRDELRAAKIKLDEFAASVNMQ